jgi:hypothetical protein
LNRYTIKFTNFFFVNLSTLKMKRDDELEDPYELDSISFGKIPMKDMINHNEEFPLRIGTNFFECDSDSFSN